MKKRSALFSWGDLNAFFGLTVDNITNLVLLATLLHVAGFPSDIVYKKMIPGTALGVLIGDTIYTIMALRLSKKTGNPNVTAMPLGLDTPSTIGIALAVLIPVFKSTNDPYLTWYVGMSTLIQIGIIKLIFSFLGGYIKKIIPQAALLGSIAGIGIALLCFIPMVHIFSFPVIGIVSMGLILYVVLRNVRLPYNLPSVFVAVIFGIVLYYLMQFANLAPETTRVPKVELFLTFPVIDFNFVKGFALSLNYLPVSLPFGILTIIGGINVTESAKVAGDDYNTRNILLTEAVSTLISGLFGGVSQTTPYIGHPAYKRLNAKAGYTLLTAIFVGIGSFVGIVSLMVALLPATVISPILIFVGIEIVDQTFKACPKKHFPAIILSFVPSIAELVRIELSKVGTIPSNLKHEFFIIEIIAHGFILTAMLWGTIFVGIIDNRKKFTAVFLVIAAVLSLFGFIHSVMPDGSVYMPFSVKFTDFHFRIAAGYLVFGIFYVISSFFVRPEKN